MAASFVRVRNITIAVLPACTYDSNAMTLTGNAVGALTVNGTAVAAGYRLLIKDQADGTQNGIYLVTNPGSGGAAFILTRVEKTNALKYDSTTTFRTDNTIAGSGTSLQGTFWTRTTDGTIGVTSWTFVTLS